MQLPSQLETFGKVRRERPGDRQTLGWTSKAERKFSEIKAT